jgi:hypothetical protein
VAKDPIKNAKNAKNAKDANPWKLAFLALLDRAGNLLIVAEAGGHTTGCGLGGVLGLSPRLKDAKDAKNAKNAKDANPLELAPLPRQGRAWAAAMRENVRNLLKLRETLRNLADSWRNLAHSYASP